jgi:repressor of nif and glnA expression
MEQFIIMEIKDNTFRRQFETTVEEGLVSVEYSFQEKKIFFNKINTPDQFDNEDLFRNYFLT